MSRFPRLRRRPDQWADAHERARTRAAERIDGPLGLAESTWLDEHLAGCQACAATAAAFEADRQALRTLRDEQPEPPRDLWARTAAAIEQLSIESGVADEIPGIGARRGRPGGMPLGAMSAFAVVVLVIGATLLTNRINPRSTATAPDAVGAAASPAASGAPEVASGGAEPTPFAVPAGDVAWIDSGPNGVSFANAQVTEVCPAEGASGCPALHDQANSTLALSSATRTIIGSPTRKQAVAIAKAEAAGDQVVIVQLPEPAPVAPQSPAPPASIQPSIAPSAATTEPPVESATPSEQPSSPATVQTSPPASPLATPEPTKAAALAIASGIEVVGESAAFSSDGAWFAFTARPSDGSRGPDVWVWHVGDPKAERLTKDGASYFASWSGDRLVASRPADPSTETSDAVSTLVDPATGQEREIGNLWRPMIDPSGRFAIAWTGTVGRKDDPSAWAPSGGRLALLRWSDDGVTAGSAGSDDHQVVTDEARGDFDVRWDESGEWVAVWVADERDPSTGRLTLYHVDAKRERLDKVKGAPREVQALPGFSIGSGRLAWATPRGKDGEGSRVQIAAWAGDGIGRVESSPGEDVHIIR
jgi:hypothetical protein